MAKQKKYKTKVGTYAKERKFGEFKSSRNIDFDNIRELPLKEALIKLGSKRGSMLKSKDIPINSIKKEDLPEARLEVQKLYATMYDTTQEEAEKWYKRQVKTGKEMAKTKNVKVFSKEDVLLQYYKARLINTMRTDEAINVTMLNERGKDINTSVYPELEGALAEKNKWGIPIITPKEPLRNIFRIHPSVEGKGSMELSKSKLSELTANRNILATIRRTAPEYIQVRVEQAKLNYIKAMDTYLAKNVDILPISKFNEVKRHIMAMDMYQFEDLWNKVPIEKYYEVEVIVEQTNSVLIELSNATGIKFNI